MRNAWTIAKREFAHYFVSPIAYAVAFMFLAFLGLLFFINMSFMAQATLTGGGGGEPSMQPTFGTFSILILFFIPVLTMRLLSEEQNKGTLELLMTAPLQEWELVFGKWLGAWLFSLCLIATTVIYALILFAKGNPDPGPIYSGYLGLALMVGALLAIGLFASSLTSNLIASVAIGYAFILMIWIVGGISSLVENVAAGLGGGSTNAVVEVLKYLDFSGHFQDSFNNGLIRSSDIVYFVSFIAVWLFLTTRVIQARRWQ